MPPKGPMVNEAPSDYVNINTAVTTVVKASPGVLRRVVVNTSAAGSITIYNALSATGTPVAILKASVAEGTYEYNVRMNTGITVVTGHNDQDVTVVYD